MLNQGFYFLFLSLIHSSNKLHLYTPQMIRNQQEVILNFLTNQITWNSNLRFDLFKFVRIEFFLHYLQTYVTVIYDESFQIFIQVCYLFSPERTTSCMSLSLSSLMRRRMLVDHVFVNFVTDWEWIHTSVNYSACFC